MNLSSVLWSILGLWTNIRNYSLVPVWICVCLRAADSGGNSPSLPVINNVLEYPLKPHNIMIEARGKVRWISRPFPQELAKTMGLRQLWVLLDVFENGDLVNVLSTMSPCSQKWLCTTLKTVKIISLTAEVLWWKLFSIFNSRKRITLGSEHTDGNH